jgi:NitT/TauT family transport system substrate-binding protein
MRTRWQAVGAGVLALSLVAAACGDDDDGGAAPDTTGAAPETTGAGTTPVTEGTTPGTEGTTPGTEGTAPAAECDAPDEVVLQLQWVIQSQFAGYLAADEQGFYEARCLDVSFLEGGVDIVPQQVLADGQADFAIAWVPKALQTREQGADIVNVAQVFQRSGTLQVSFADAGITSPEDFAGRKIGNWGFGNEYEIFAALGEAGLDPASDVELVQQQFNMDGLLARDIDAAEAMTYNEYAQVLEAENPDTGELYQPEDLNVISYEEVGVGMLQDAVWADGARLGSDEAYRDIAVRFLAASFEGWAYCRDDPEACRDIVVAAGSQLGDSHQLWQMNEINKLIWPAENGIGYIDQAAWDRTVEIAQNTPNLEGATVLGAPPTEGAYTNEIVEEAHALLGDSVDLNGEDFTPIEVTLEPGGA